MPSQALQSTLCFPHMHADVFAKAARSVCSSLAVDRRIVKPQVPRLLLPSKDLTLRRLLFRLLTLTSQSISLGLDSLLSSLSGSLGLCTLDVHLLLEDSLTLLLGLGLVNLYQR